MTDQQHTRVIRNSAGLIDCPFCGCSDIWLGIYSGNATIFCNGCPASMGGEESPLSEDAIVAAWNRRNTQTSPDPRQPVAHVCDQAGGA